MELPGFAGPTLEAPAPALDLCQSQRKRMGFLEQRKYGPHLFGFYLVHHQPPPSWINVVAQHRITADPFSLPPSRRHLVAGTLADEFALELRKRKQDIQ